MRAAIAALQTEERIGTTVAALYDRLRELTGSAVVEFNRAVAVAEFDGPRAALLRRLDDTAGGGPRTGGPFSVTSGDRLDGFEVGLCLGVLGEGPVDAGQGRVLALAFPGADDQILADVFDAFSGCLAAQHGVQHVVGDDRGAGHRA
ncbi:hypothetical protein [Nonomuraea jabiensis]|uniref:hypothetical protein n=1 Tax=Nonomuraea jabiensis TaxID=882448 RepID=UPI00369487E6